MAIGFFVASRSSVLYPDFISFIFVCDCVIYVIEEMSKYFIKTRTSDCRIFGSAKNIFPENAVQLPTYEDVMSCYQSVRLELKGNCSKEPSAASVANIVA